MSGPKKRRNTSARHILKALDAAGINEIRIMPDVNLSDNGLPYFLVSYAQYEALMKYQEKVRTKT